MNKDEMVTLLSGMPQIAPGEERDREVSAFLKSEKVRIKVIRTAAVGKKPVFKSMPVVIPVRENNWESYHSGVNPGQHVIVPSRELAEAEGLSLRPPNWDMYDRNGELASKSVHWGNWLTGHNLCYLRKDILDRFMTRHRLDFIWAVWGAREVRLPRFEYHRMDEEKKKEIKHWRKGFQQLYHYKDGHIISGRASEHYE